VFGGKKLSTAEYSVEERLFLSGEKRILLAFPADRGRRPMARQDFDAVVEWQQFGPNPREQKLPVPAGKIPAADAAPEQDVAADEGVFCRKEKAEAPGAMTGHMEGSHGESEKLPRAFVNEEICGEGLNFQLEPPLAEIIFFLGHRDGVGVVADLAAMALDDGRRVRNVVEVSMGEQKEVNPGVGEGGVGTLGGIKKNISLRGCVEERIGIKDAAGKDFELIHWKVVSQNN